MACRGKLFIATILLLSSAAAATEAAPLPLYSVIGDVAFNRTPPDRLFPHDFGTFSLVAAEFGSVSLVAAGVPLPSLRADADIGPNLQPSIFGRADGLLSYAMEIVGPVNAAVPVLIDVNGTADGSAGLGASFAIESRWNLFDGDTSLEGDDMRSGQLTGDFHESFSRTVSLVLAANHPYSVFLLADAAAAATADGSHAVAHAFVDPLFSFGPGVDPSLYSFRFSDGIGNGSPGSTPTPVPEPGTLVLVCAGLLSTRRLRVASRRGSHKMGDRERNRPPESYFIRKPSSCDSQNTCSSPPASGGSSY
jgi:hypothetical protein